MVKKVVLSICISLILIMAFQNAQAQFMETPQASPKAMVMQRIGITDVTITYHRPGVKGRKTWGELVPFNEGKPFPWRAGANENTTISFTHDVTINGSALPAGTYGFHTIPSEKDWILIFSKNNASWGSYFYKPEEDALRVTVTPVEAPHQERLLYGFDELTDNSVVASLHWGKLKVNFKIETDVHTFALDKVKNELRAGYGFFWWGYNNAANYCLNYEVHIDQGLDWVDQSIKMEKNYRNLATKGQLLAKKGDTNQAKEVLKSALDLAPERAQKRIQTIIDELESP